MKIVQLTPGSGGTFYCENCIRDNALAQTLRQRGHDTIMVPLYLPLLGETESPARGMPVFFGAITCYLEEKVPLFRRLPKRLARLLDARPLLRLAARQAGSTNPRGLESMTLSMLRGEHGRQAAELERLIEWLEMEGRPDVVLLSNALLLGLARRLKEALGAPVYCLLQDEQVWMDAMHPSRAEPIWEEMAERARDIDTFIAVSAWYGGKMKARLRLRDEQLVVIPVGLPLDPDAPRSDRPFDPPVLGWLSRLSEPLGFDRLIDAFLLLKKEPAWHRLRLHAAGGWIGEDEAFLARQRRKVESAGYANDVAWLPALTGEDRRAFLRGLTVVSVPMPGGEAFGLFQLEAMAEGVPVVQPREGAFTEIVEATGGGILYEPNTAEALAEALRALLAQPERVRALGEQGRQSVRQDYTSERMAERFEALWTRPRARGVATA